MNRRLLNYTPDMEFLEHAEAHHATASADPHAAMALSAFLLEVANQGELEDFPARRAARRRGWTGFDAGTATRSTAP